MEREELNKSFSIGFKDYTIARIDYESMPCAMQAVTFSDEKMQELADRIGERMKEYKCSREHYSSDEHFKEAMDEIFWECMENAATTEFGMQYYEDL